MSIRHTLLTAFVATARPRIAVHSTPACKPATTGIERVAAGEGPTPVFQNVPGFRRTGKAPTRLRTAAWFQASNCGVGLRWCRVLKISGPSTRTLTCLPRLPQRTPAIRRTLLVLTCLAHSLQCKTRVPVASPAAPGRSKACTTYVISA